MKHDLFNKISLTLFVGLLTLLNLLAHFDIWFSWSNNIDKVAIDIFNLMGLYIIYIVWTYKEE